MGNAINIPRYVSPKQAIRSALGNLGKGNLMQTMEPDLIRWSIEAQDLISPINVLQKKSEIFKVSDNRVTLCEDFKMVECVKINGVPLRYLGGRNCQYITKGCYDSCNTIGSGLGFSVDSCYVHFSPAIQDGTEVEVTWLQRPVGDDGIPLVVEQCLIAVQDYISWMICLRTMDNRAGIHEKNWYYRCRTARAEMNRFAESQRQQLGVQYLSVYNNPFYDWDAYMGACGGGSGGGSGSGSGVPGPQGPQGPAGPQGPQGPAGSAAMALQQYATQGDFPATGDVNTLYLDQSDDSLYYWDEATLAYIATAGGGGGGVWGTIVGVLSNQTDLQNALNAKQDVSNLSINVVADQTSNVKYPSVKAVYDWVLSLGYITASALTGYATQSWVTAQGYITNVITALGYTPEDIANKSTNVVTDQASNTKYPSVKAVYDWVLSLGYITASALTGYATQAWVTSQGYITNVITALGYTPENVTNKSTSVPTDQSSNTKYPSVKAVYDWVLSLGYITSSALTNYVQNTRTISTTTPLAGGGDLSANRTISIADAVADGATKGAAAFNANDFNSASGVITIDYANGQKASASQPGFLSSTDFSTFNNKVTSVSAGTGISVTGTTTPIISVTRFYSNITTDSGTSNTTATILGVIMIPANTVSAGKVVKINFRYTRNNTTNNASPVVNFNTSNSLIGATGINSNNITGATNTTLYGNKLGVVKSATNTEFGGAGVADDTGQGVAVAAPVSYNINWTVDIYFLFTGSVAVNTTTITLSFAEIIIE